MTPIGTYLAELARLGEALGEHRRRQTEERAVIELADTNDLVFTWPDRRPLHPDLITDWFQRSMAAAMGPGSPFVPAQAPRSPKFISVNRSIQAAYRGSMWY